MSIHFSRAEWEYSNTATRHGKDNTMPDDYWYDNAERHNKKVLEPLRAYLHEITGKDIAVVIRSGYRCPWLNRKIGGAKHSSHLKALATDIVSHRYGTPYDLAQAIRNAEVIFDQLILEFGRWVHVSTEEKDKLPRRQVLTAYKISWNRTRYKSGIVQVREQHPVKRFFYGDILCA